MDEQRHYLPPEWNNEERMRALMGPMPSALDEVSKRARLTFWTAAVHHWCSVTFKLTFTLQECLSAFRRGTQQPLCLPEVLVHMNGLGEAVPLDEVPLGERNEESWVGWGLRVLVAAPSRFTWKKAKQVLGVDNLLGKVFVDTKLIQEMSERVLKSYWESSSREPPALRKPLTMASLYSKVGHCVGSADNLHLVIESLAYTGRATTVIHKDTTYVKFAMPGDVQKPVISQLELAEEELRSAQKTLEASIDQLNSEIATLQQEAKSAVKERSRSKALSLLRRKKRAGVSLDRQFGALENITASLLQLQETHVNKQVLDAFRDGVVAIRASVGDRSADDAATTMDELQQVLEECEDVSSLLAGRISSQEADIDDDVLMKELDQLIIHDQGEKRIGQDLAGVELPEVPKSNPVTPLPQWSLPTASPM